MKPRMRLSTAIRVGSKIFPEGDVFCHPNGSCCALGAAWGTQTNEYIGNTHQLLIYWPQYPLDKLNNWSNMHYVGWLVHVDQDPTYSKEESPRYTREQIADLVEEWEIENLGPEEPNDESTNVVYQRRLQDASAD